MLFTVAAALPFLVDSIPFALAAVLIGTLPRSRDLSTAGGMRKQSRSSLWSDITPSVLLQTLRQFIVPDQLMARVSSVMGMLGVGIGLPPGSVAGGLLAHTFGLRAPFLVSSALIALTVIVVPRISTAFEVLEARAE